MKKILLILLLLPVLVFGQATDLFFSEYIEGTSFNKAIEIYNGTGSEVELSNYLMRGSANEATGWEYLYIFPEGATISSGDVYVICHPQAGTEIQAVQDWNTDTYAANTTGNDARGLFRINGQDTILIDLLGDPNNPNGSNYDVAGETSGMAEHTIVRKSSVTQGNTNWAASAGTNADDSEWIVYGQNEFSYLGFHTMGGDASPIISDVTFEVFNPGSIDLNATVVDDGSITDVSLTYYFIEDDVAGMPVTVAMDAAGDDVYSVTVDASTLSDGDGFVYYIEATDDATPTANVTTSNDYKVLMGVTPLIKLHNVLLGKTLMYDGFLVKSTGIANVEAGLFSQNYYSFYMQDATGGINLYKNESVATIYNLGDELIVTGIVDEYNNLTELIFETIVVNSTGNSVTPVEMTSD
ncbi:MAG: lamin tail domain-containing protein, partial [Calditrichia bacterium]|nr:lamin tail domain-containing protein [Calditrichia bacterium]